MSELFVPGKILPKGYTLAITSWENDGDDYNTVFVKGLPTKEIVNEVLHVLQWFAPIANDMGNEDIQHAEILDRLWDRIEDCTITKDFFDRFLDGVEFPVIGTDEEHDDWLERVELAGGYEAVEDMVRGFNGYPIQYDANFARMVEKVSIHFFEEDFKVPNMPPEVASFSGAWTRSNITFEWKL